MGFCFFNGAAIAARHAQKKHGIERAAVVDFDVHHEPVSRNVEPSLFHHDADIEKR
jgi:hypothetical protein